MSNDGMPISYYDDTMNILLMSIEQEIIDYIYTHHSHKKYCFFGERPEVTLDTELTKGGLNIIWEDAEDTLDYYFK